jgi:hypothetical protein
MARFARAFSARCGKQTFLLWLVNNDASSAHEASQRAGLTTSQYRVTSSPADRVTQYLSAADVGMALIKPCFSKRSSSPTKYGEYLAAGLPIVINRDVGDGAVIAERGGAVALTGTETEDHNAGADELLRLLTQPRTAFRAIAKSLFDVDQIALPAYRRLYSSLVSS